MKIVISQNTGSLKIRSKSVGCFWHIFPQVRPKVLQQRKITLELKMTIKLKQIQSHPFLVNVDLRCFGESNFSELRRSDQILVYALIIIFIQVYVVLSVQGFKLILQNIFNEQEHKIQTELGRIISISLFTNTLQKHLVLYCKPLKCYNSELLQHEKSVVEMGA